MNWKGHTNNEKTDPLERTRSLRPNGNANSSIAEYKSL